MKQLFLLAGIDESNNAWGELPREPSKFQLYKANNFPNPNAMQEQKNRGG